MAKNDNLTDFLAGLADKFRALLGTSDPLNPQEFEDKIQAVRDAAYTEGFAAGGPTGITAKAADVLAGKVFGSGGSAKATGTMPSRSSVSTASKVTYDGVRVMGRFPYGYYPNYDSAGAVLYQPNADVASAVGLTAAKLLKGQAVLGITGTGVSTPAQIGVKPFLYYEFNDYMAPNVIGVGTAPCNGTLRLYFVKIGDGSTQGCDYFKCGANTKTGNSWLTREAYGYADVAATKGGSISFKLKTYGNNSGGYIAFVYYISVS